MYVDDPNIAADAVLWRRIFPKWKVLDENVGGWRVSSAAFDDSDDGTPTSIYLCSVVIDSGRSVNDLLSGFDGYGMASLLAGSARGCGMAVVPAPEPDEPAHAFLAGKKSKPAKRCLYRAAQWVVPPS